MLERVVSVRVVGAACTKGAGGRATRETRVEVRGFRLGRDGGRGDQHSDGHDERKEERRRESAHDEEERGEGERESIEAGCKQCVYMSRGGPGGLARVAESSRVLREGGWRAALVGRAQQDAVENEPIT